PAPYPCACLLRTALACWQFSSCWCSHMWYNKRCADMISIDHVSFGYGETQETLSQVSTVIAPGECVLLCGASGCGKTTVIKLINGLIPAFTPGCRLEGRVEVDGLDPGTTPMYELARKVG